MARTAPAYPSSPARAAGFGGIVPSTVVARDPSALVAALAVEHYADGALVMLLVLSETPGVLALDPLDDIEVHDDLGRRYDARLAHGQAGLGSAQAALWIEPGLPADARVLDVGILELARVTSPRGGGGVTRPLHGGPWRLAIDLVPPRTRVPVPSRPGSARPGQASPARVPARTLRAFRDLVPIGQARMRAGSVVCLHALERYDDLAILTLSTKMQDGDAHGAGAAPISADTEGDRGNAALIEVWDDRGAAYRAELEHSSGAEGWSDQMVRLTPALDPGATSLGISVAATQAGGGIWAVFGVALPLPR